MALSNGLTLVQNIDGVTGLITDTTVGYGVGGDPARAARANFLLYSKNDRSGVRTFYNLATALPLSQMSWDISTELQGWTSGTLLRINTWDNGESYVEEVTDGQGIITTPASIIYYQPTNKVYKCIQSHSNIAPDGLDGDENWEEVSDLSDLIDYETVEQFTVNFQIDISINACVSKGFININNACGCNASLKELEPAIKNWALYFSATANFNNDAPEKMQVITEQLTDICKTCK